MGLNVQAIDTELRERSFKTWLPTPSRAHKVKAVTWAGLVPRPLQPSSPHHARLFANSPAEMLGGLVFK